MSDLKWMHPIMLIERCVSSRCIDRLMADYGDPMTLGMQDEDITDMLTNPDSVLATVAFLLQLVRILVR